MYENTSFPQYVKDASAFALPNRTAGSVFLTCWSECPRLLCGAFLPRGCVCSWGRRGVRQARRLASAWVFLRRR